MLALEYVLIDSKLLAHIFTLGIVSITLLMRALAVLAASLHDHFGVESVGNFFQLLDIDLVLFLQGLATADLVPFGIKLATARFCQLLVGGVLVGFRFFGHALTTLCRLQGAASEFLVVMCVAAGVIHFLTGQFI